MFLILTRPKNVIAFDAAEFALNRMTLFIVHNRVELSHYVSTVESRVTLKEIVRSFTFVGDVVERDIREINVRFGI